MCYMIAAPEALDATFAALADPTRRAILTRLARGEATVMELAEPFGLKAADRWLDKLRAVLESNYARLDAVLAAMPPEPSRKRRPR